MEGSWTLGAFALVLVGAAAAGVLGAVLAAPVIATAQVVVGYLYTKILQQPGSEGESPAEQSTGPAMPANVNAASPEETDHRRE